MTPASARVLGAIAAVLLGVSWFAWQRLKPRECTGGVFIELRPPLAAPGPYAFKLDLDGGERRCEFAASPGEQREVSRPQCGLTLELHTRVNGDEHTIVGLTVGAAPEKLRLRVERGAERLYDAELTPSYAPYPTHKDDSKRFCGERAFVQPECIRGSSQCVPFSASCSGPKGCAEGKVCCASLEWGREYGARSATECSSQRRCLDRFARIVCQSDDDCPSTMACSDSSLSSDFQPPLRACADKPSPR